MRRSNITIRNTEGTGGGRALMKKLVAWLLAASMLLLFAACAAEESGTAISGALPEILDRIYDMAQVDDETRDFLKTGLVTTDLPSEALGEGLGIEEMPKADVVASEPTAEGVPFFACLLRMPGGTDVEAQNGAVRRGRFLRGAQRRTGYVRRKRRQSRFAGRGGERGKIQRGVFCARRINQVPRRGTFFIGAVSGGAQSGKKGTAPVRGAVFS